MSTLWEGRFDGPPADELMALSRSVQFDRRLATDDLEGSRAHVRGLLRAGIMSEADADSVLVALDEVESEVASGRLEVLPSDEDIHTAIERRVTELAGDAGARLHTGRSRNDQVATDLRLFCKRELLATVRAVSGLQHALADRAEAAGDAYLPGYTHLQRAQPVPLAHHLLAHGWALARDVDRLLATRARLDVSPLGAGALAGSSLPLDPETVADDLGFASVFENSLDAVSDRDFVAEALFDLALLGIHLSRLAEELVLWSTEEFGFVRLDDRYATGSSMLPQKKNPDVAELTRAKSGRLIGHVAGLLAALKGLPLSYNRDLQEDKEPLFDALDQLALVLPALTGVVRTARFDVERMAEAASGAGLAAVDLAEHLVGRGVPFRQAHALVGDLVRRSVAEGVPLDRLVAAHEDLGPEAAGLLEPGAPLRRPRSRGGGGPASMSDQLERFGRRLAEQESEARSG